VRKFAFIDGIMDHKMYIQLLKENLKTSAISLGIPSNFHFYQDNDPKHKALNTRLWLLHNCPKVMETPPQSPDINPIENLWDHLGRQVQRRRPSNKDELKKSSFGRMERD
jgi:transposase